MSCQEAFSIFALQESSYENEFAVTDLCLPNTTKLGLFLTWLCCFSILFLFSVGFLIQEMQKSMSWTLKKACFFTLSLACAAEIITYSLYLAGVQNREKYAVFALSTVAIIRTIFFIVEAWFQVFASFHPNINQMLSKIKLGFRLVTLFCGITFVVLHAIVPIIVADNPFVLNWVYGVGVGFLGIYTLLVLSVIQKSGSMLVSTCSNSAGFELQQGGNEVSYLIHKVQRFTFVMSLLYPLSFLVMLFPLWVGLTQTSTNPGLEYSSYFQFGVLAFSRAYMIFFLLWLVKRRSSSIGMGSSGNKPVSVGNNQRLSINDLRFSGKSPEVEIEVAQGFPRFSIEELNGAPKEEEKVEI